VLATQNPVELEGTFPLPEAQIDRFLLRLAVGYPDRDEEREILHRFRSGNPLADIKPVAGAAEISAAGALCRAVYTHPAIENYLLDLVAASRSNAAIALGISPRGSLALHHAAQALAAIQGRAYVIPEDIKRLAQPVLAHRLILDVNTRMHGKPPREVLDSLLAQVSVPVEETWAEEAAGRGPAEA
jgi:MoxR-like ATPase